MCCRRLGAAQQQAVGGSHARGRRAAPGAGAARRGRGRVRDARVEEAGARQGAYLRHPLQSLYAGAWTAEGCCGREWVSAPVVLTPAYVPLAVVLSLFQAQRESLPIFKLRDELIQAVTDNQVRGCTYEGMQRSTSCSLSKIDVELGMRPCTSAGTGGDR
eukprot:scaffold6691_cov358-Prasinococcus_capsulatus_cf.AAC.18